MLSTLAYTPPLCSVTHGESNAFVYIWCGVLRERTRRSQIFVYKMATRVFGTMSEYIMESEDITEWLERLEQWFIANEIESVNRKRSLLLTFIGRRGYKLLRSLAQNEPTLKTYAELTKLLLDHLNPKPNEIAQRYVFYKRDRRAGETVKDFVAELRKLSEHCNFAEKLDDHLRDKFVCGLNDEKVQQKLLATQKLTLKTAIETAVGMEAAARSAKQIHGVGVEVHKLSGQGGSGGKKGGFKKATFSGGNSGNRNVNKKECHRCGGTNHTPDKCKFKSAECYVCHKFGHTSKRCEQNTGSSSARVHFEEIVTNEEGEKEDADIEEGVYALGLYRVEVVMSDIEEEESFSDEENEDAEEEYFSDEEETTGEEDEENEEERDVEVEESFPVEEKTVIGVLPRPGLRQAENGNQRDQRVNSHSLYSIN